MEGCMEVMDRSVCEDGLQIRAERISLTCPYTQRRIVQAGRKSTCMHASAFCAISAEKSSVCPICGAAGDVQVDAQLTLFLSSHPDAITCEVRRGTNGQWVYAKPCRKRIAKSSGRSTDSRSHCNLQLPGTILSSEIDVKSGASHSHPRVWAPRVVLGAPKSAEQRRLDRAARTHRAALRKSIEQAHASLVKRALSEDTTGAEHALWHSSDAVA